MVKLGVNIDHVASVRELRKGAFPEPAIAALIAQEAKAASIVVHLREDRRHIKDADLYILKQVVKTKLNLEMSTAPEIVGIACKIRPDQATLVPEKRKELTTEGGLNVAANLKLVRDTVNKLKKNGIIVSLFIDPEKKQIDAARKSGVNMIELHTGRFANAKNNFEQEKYLKEISDAVKYAKKLKLSVNAGHGLDYNNVSRIARIKGIEELNIGYSIICRSVIVGLKQAIKEMRDLL